MIDISEDALLTWDGLIRFTTSYMKFIDGRGPVKFGGEIHATSWAEAEKIANAKTPIETVDGILIEETFIDDYELEATREGIRDGMFGNMEWTDPDAGISDQEEADA